MGRLNTTRFCKCKFIDTLDVCGTNVTKTDVEIILVTLPKLKYWKSDYQMQMLADLLRGPLDKNVPCITNLNSLSNCILVCTSVYHPHNFADSDWSQIVEVELVTETLSFRRKVNNWCELNGAKWDGGCVTVGNLQIEKLKKYSVLTAKRG